MSSSFLAILFHIVAICVVYMVFGNLEKLNKQTFAPSITKEDVMKMVTTTTFISREQIINETVYNVDLEESDRLKIGNRSSRKLAKWWNSARKCLVNENVLFEAGSSAPSTSWIQKALTVLKELCLARVIRLKRLLELCQTMQRLHYA